MKIWVTIENLRFSPFFSLQFWNLTNIFSKFHYHYKFRRYYYIKNDIVIKMLSITEKIWKYYLENLCYECYINIFYNNKVWGSLSYLRQLAIEIWQNQTINNVLRNATNNWFLVQISSTEKLYSLEEVWIFQWLPP